MGHLVLDLVTRLRFPPHRLHLSLPQCRLRAMKQSSIRLAEHFAKRNISLGVLSMCLMLWMRK